MNDDHFGVEESAALLHVIFPSYSELYEIKPAPQVGDGANWTQVY